MVDYTLKCFAESENAYKAALILQLCDANWDTEWVVFFHGESKSDGFLDLNSMAEVPVLIDHTNNGNAISQSAVILMHLADRFGKFVPDNRADELEMMRWLFFDNHKLTSYTATYRFLSRFMNKDGEPEAEFMKARMLGSFKIFNRHLENHDWVAANQPTLADISTCGYLFWPDHFNVTWDDYSGIKQWLARIQELPNWAAPEALLPVGPKE